MPRPSLQLHDPAYARRVASRYVDPVEVIWLATAQRLGLTIRRDPGIFSMTDGSGTLWFSTREHLDEDDNLAQMLFHELCHWITNGLHTFTERDWGFPLYDEEDVREHGCVRLQCWWATRHGLRAFFGPTSQYRQYYEQVPADPLQPLDDSDWERAVVGCAADAIRRAQGEPWWGPVDAAMAATAQVRALLGPFAADYRSEHEADSLPLLWIR